MAEAISSVLLVDYDNLQRSFAVAGGQGQIADRVIGLLAALEDGRSLGARGGARRIAVKRCYTGPMVTEKVRNRLTAAGFDVVGAGDGTRGSADLHMAMDTIEALTRPTTLGEFILLSPGSELAPLIARLKVAKRTAVILADGATTSTDKSMADILIDPAELVNLPVSEDAPAPDTRAPAAANERADIEAFARKIHAATNIPLLSPKTFAELFRQLTEEIATNGYHFQTTAKNVADSVAASGRNVTRRQVVFIVKGLALKGHVFSTGDNAERLAEVFREQARYLIANAGISLDPREEQLLVAWFQGRPAPAARAPAAAPAPRTPAAAPAAASATVPPSAETRARIAETIEREVAKAVVPPPERARQQARPAPVRPPQVKPVELPKSSARGQQTILPVPTAREEAKAVIAARIAASAKMKKPFRPSGPLAPVPANVGPTTAPPEPPEGDEQAAAALASETLETSILAAIAEAVDVLVDPAETRERPALRPAPNARGQRRAQGAPPQPAPEPAPEPTEVDDGESGDIGDQIQRIIASYNRNRQEE